MESRKLIYQVTCAKGNHTLQFDEQLRLVYAEDHLHVFYKARLIGESVNTGNVLSCVEWKVVDVNESHVLTELTDGAELHSKVVEEEETERYIGHIQKKLPGCCKKVSISSPD